MTEEQLARLRDWLAGATGDAALRIAAARKLSGGAIQQNWALEIESRGATQGWVLRTDSAAVLAVSLPRAAEYALLRAAHAAGETVAEPLLLCEDTTVIGAHFFVMRRVAGEALGRRILRSEELHDARSRLVEQCAGALAQLHSVR